MSNWLEPLDNYCERTDASLWSEPLNALTNLSFILAGLLIVRLYRTHRKVEGASPALLTLTALLFMIGIGSALFHTLATRWALLADVIPITLFIYTYQGVFLRRVFAWPRLWIALYLVGFFLFGHAMSRWFGEDALNGSLLYLPALLALLGFAAFMRWHAKPGARDVLLAAGLFTLSLTCRTLDAQLCTAFPPGTHFLWHLLNGAVLYVLMRGLMHLFPLSLEGRVEEPVR